MINYLYVNNYKSFVNFRIEFDQINLILGKNGSGKSNIFYLIFAIVSLIRGNNNTLSQYFTTSTSTRWLKSNIQTFELGLSDNEHKYVYSLEIEQDSDKQVSRILSEKVVCDDHILYKMMNGDAALYDDDFYGTSVLTDNSVSGISFAPLDSKHTHLNGFRRVIDEIVLCVPDPKAMDANVKNEELGSRVNFSNIASIYAGLVQTDTDVYSDLVDTLKAINPDLQKIRIAINPFGRHLMVEYQYKDVPCPFSFNELSDGEKMTFALYLLLYGYVKKGYTVLLDEPDNFLSLREIQPWCIEMENEIEDGGQCIMISHHPEIIDYLAASDGIWMSRLHSGESVIVDDPHKDSDNTELLKYSELIARGVSDEA